MHAVVVLWALMAQSIVNEDHVLSLTFSPDGRFLAGAGGPGVIVWDLEKGQKATIERTAVYVVVYSPDGAMLLTGGADGLIGLWDGRTLKKHTVEVQDHHEGRPIAFGFSGDARRLFSTGADCSSIEWDLSNGKLLKRFKPDKKLIPLRRKVAGSPDGKYLLLSALKADAPKGIRSSIHVWDTATGAVVKHLEHEAAFGAVVAFSPDSKYLADVSYGADDKDQFSLREVASGKEVFADSTDGLVMTAIAFSSDGTFVFYALTDGQVYAVDLKKRERARTYKKLKGTIEAIAVSKDGKVLAAAAQKEIRLWNVKTGEEIAVPRK